jgi:opacity protein-like surface antigen
MKTLLLSTAAAVLAAAGAHAQDAGQFHVGGGYTWLDADEVELDTLNLRGGYDFTPYLGVEGEVLVGLGDESVTVGSVTGDVSLDYGLGAFAKAQFPVNEQFSVFGRLGYAYWEAEASVGGFTLSDEEDGVAYGVGGEWAFAGPNAVRVDYTRYDFDNAETDAFGVSYVRRF